MSLKLHDFELFVVNQIYYIIFSPAAFVNVVLFSIS